jgi:hypothetical protein
MQRHLLNQEETKMFTDYQVKDQAYHYAVHTAKREISLGFALSYSVGHDNERGRYVEVETDQGWNPAVWWQEIEPDYYYYE